MLSKQRLSWIKELNHYQRLNQTYTFYFEFFHDGMQGHSVDFKFCMCWVILKKIFAPLPPPPQPNCQKKVQCHTAKLGLYPESDPTISGSEDACMTLECKVGRVFILCSKPRGFVNSDFHIFGWHGATKGGGGNVTLKEPIYIFLNIQT